MPKPGFKFRLSHLLTAVAVAAVCLTALALSTSLYEVYGAVRSVAYDLILVVLVLTVLAGVSFKRFRLPVLVAAILVCAGLGWRHAVLLRRLHNLKAEVARIVVYVDQYQSDHGQPPADLSDYSYEHPVLRNFIEYGPAPPGISYQIWFNPTGERSYGHYYYSGFGYSFEDD